MVKINYISGMSCVGKSYYINQSKADNDIVIDLFKFQQEHGDYVTAEYLFYSQIGRTLHRAKNCTIWIEVPFPYIYSTSWQRRECKTKKRMQ